MEFDVELVRNARRGDKEAGERLAEVASECLRVFLSRLRLDANLTEDIVQESICEMFKSFKELRKAERCWSWLRGIAYNLVLRHRRGKKRERNALESAVVAGISDNGTKGAYAEAVSRELKEVVLKAMDRLKPRHRDVLIMRCYEQMPYKQIAEAMRCSKWSAETLFYRAKKSFAKELARHGLGKGYLLAALVLFGKVTASSEAAAANVSVTAATLKIGTAASLAAIAASKTGVVTIAGAALITAGAVAIKPSTVESHNGRSSGGYDSSLIAGMQDSIEARAEESWHYYPDGPGGAVMMRLSESDGGREDCRFRILQNQHGNYRYENGVIYMDNHRPYNADLSVRRLPTDGRALSAFLSQIEGAVGDMEYVSASGAGLLVISKRDKDMGDRIWRVDRHSNVLDEVFFQLDWPEGTKRIDNRDAMHERGWTYFRVSGQIDGEQVTGKGRIPFVYETSKKHYPWADIRIGRRLRIVDSGRGAAIYDAGGKAIESFAAGSFFDCLGCPWRGLHTIDAVRRTAAKAKIPFETKRIAKNKAQITITGTRAALAYEIDLEKDIVETIKVLGDSGEQDIRAELSFTYIEEISPATSDFTAPSHRQSIRATNGRLGVMWPAKLLGPTGRG